MICVPVFHGGDQHFFSAEAYANFHSANLCIQSKHGKTRTRKNFVFGHFSRNENLMKMAKFVLRNSYLEFNSNSTVFRQISGTAIDTKLVLYAYIYMDRKAFQKHKNYTIIVALVNLFTIFTAFINIY